MKTCLVVDDSRVIRMVARKILEDLGFDVTEAENGQIALDICQKSLPDGVLLDWVMPVMDGIALALNVARERPELPVMLMTGYAHQQERPPGPGGIGVGVGRKPFTLW